MVAPESNSVGSLQRPQAPAANQAANRQVAQAVLNKTPAVAKTTNAPTQLASANSPPSSNLPRGSIVDKLV